MKRSVIAVALCAGRAFADPATADKLSADAEALTKAGNFADAAEKYKAAWREDPHRSVFLCNAGITEYKAKDLVRAHLMLGQCLEQSALDPTRRAAVRAALDATEKVLRASGHTPISITSQPSATSITIEELGSDEAFVGSRVVWLPFGTYHVRAHAEGYADETQTVASQTQNPVQLTFALAPTSRQKPVEPLVLKRADRTPPHHEEPPPPPERAHPTILLPIATTVVTAAAVVVAVYAHGRASDIADHAQTSFDPSTFAAEKSSADSWNTGIGIGTGVAVVGAVASAYLWYRYIAAPSVEVQASAHGISLGYTARF